MEKKYKIRNISCKEIIGCLFIAVSLIMLINSIRLCFSSDIWYDELFTIGMVEHSYGELIGFTARDVHPPLYYCIVKFILDLCKLIFPLADSVVIVKLVSVLPYFLLFIYALVFLRKRFGLFVSGIFMFCILAMPQMSAYTVEMRMYGWALFFVSAAFFHAYGIMCGGGSVTACGNLMQKCTMGSDACEHDVSSDVLYSSGIDKKYIWNYVAITLYGLAAAYTQYFACVAVIMIYLCLLVWGGFKALKGWLICVGLSIIGYLPWLFVLISQINAVRDNYWILPLTWRSIGGCVKFLMKPAFNNDRLNVVMAVVLFGIYAALAAVYGYSLWRKPRIGMRREIDADAQSGIDGEKVNAVDVATFFYTISGCLVLCGLVLFGFIASAIIRPIFVYRYMVPAAGCFWLCFALCLYNLSGGADSSPFCNNNIQSNSFINNSLKNHNPKNNCFSKRNLKNKMRILCPYIVATFVLIVGIRDYRAFAGEEEYKAALMKDTAQAISAIDKDDIILYNFDQLQAVCGYYINQENYLWNGEPETLIADMFGNKGSIQDAGTIKEWLNDGRTVWFFGSFNSREDIRKEWEKDGISTDEIGSYMLERYWFNIYKVYL